MQTGVGFNVCKILYVQNGNNRTFLMVQSVRNRRKLSTQGFYGPFFVMEIVIVWILSTANLSLVKIALTRTGGIDEGERRWRQRGERQRRPSLWMATRATGGGGSGSGGGGGSKDDEKLAIKDAENIALKAQLTAKDAENTALKAQLTAKDAENTALKAQLTAKDAENTALKAQLTAKDAENTALKAQLTAKDAENTALKAQLTARTKRGNLSYVCSTACPVCVLHPASCVCPASCVLHPAVLRASCERV
jgi:hypothetical protein